MDPSNSEEDVLSTLKKKIAEGELWLNRCRTDLKHVAGIQKLVKKFDAELNFLKKLQVSGQSLKSEQVQSSNLGHLTAVVDAALTREKVVSVLRPFHFRHPVADVEANRVVVDVVCDSGFTWVKVVARKGDAVSLVCQGRGQFGERSVVHHARVLVACARHNEIHYRLPSVCFIFYNGVTEEVTAKLTDEGVSVKCFDRALLLDPPVRAARSLDSSGANSSQCLLENGSVILNLDVSTMLAYVSSITNGGANDTFLEPVLAEQAAREQTVAVRPLLDSLFTDRKLVCCATAHADFRSILGKVGGQTERQRGEILLDRVCVVPDCRSPELDELKIGGKVKVRSLIIFGTGRSMKAVTVTANAGFVRAAASQGVSIPVFVHESRALGEIKSVVSQGLEESPP